ncbi:MAG: helix-turn-helix domain-containing protein, partial [Planctomycetes bacterium]|nr:helix-turn-helix domain-containing protein [Planctomycetota bacterium]
MGRRVDIGRLKELREEAGLTQGALGQKAGKSKRTIERIEQGWSCNLSTIQKIAAVLGVEPNELLLLEPGDEEGSDVSRAAFAFYFARIMEVFGSVKFLGLAHRRDEPAIAFADTQLGGLLSSADNQSLLDAIRCGRAILLFDGIDEIGSIERREQLHAAIWEGLIRYPASRVVLTSRIVGYEKVPFDRRVILTPSERVAFVAHGLAGLGKTKVASLMRAAQQRGLGADSSDQEKTDDEPLDTLVPRHRNVGAIPSPDDLPVLYVAPFDDERIRAFALNWYGQRENSDRLARMKTDSLIAAIARTPGVGVLARTPNMLTLIALIQNIQADLPEGKANLYGKIAESYLDTIDNFRKIKGLGDDTLLDKMRWLGRLAFEMQKRRTESGSEARPDVLIPLDEVRSILAGCMGRRGDRDVTAFIDRVRQRSGLLTERGADQYAFTHLSFQEYFAGWFMLQTLRDYYAAKALRPEQTPSTENDVKLIREHVDDPNWIEAYVFFFEILADEWPQFKDDVRRELLGAEWESGQWVAGWSTTKFKLLAQLACNRYVKLEEATEAALTTCLLHALHDDSLYEFLSAGNSATPSIAQKIAFIGQKGERPW